MTTTVQPYNKRKSPQSFDSGWSDTEHSAIQRAIATVHGDGLHYGRGTVIRNILHPDFGGKGDGSDDSQALLNAIADLPATVGGAIILPPPPGGRYAFNIPSITKPNVTIIGTGGGEWGTGAVVTPFDPTLPVMVVGDSSVGATGFTNFPRLKGITFSGNGPNGQGQIGLKVSGVQIGFFDELAFTNFTKHCIRVESGANPTFGGTAFLWFTKTRVHSSRTQNRAMISLAYGAGGTGPLQYVTATYFDKLAANGNSWGDGGTVSSADATSLSDSTKNWTVNAWTSMAVCIVSGTGAGQFRDVASNTATQVVTTTPWSVIPDGTSVYDVVGFIVENDGVHATMSNTWIDAFGSRRSVRMAQSGASLPSFDCQNVTLDSPSSTDAQLIIPSTSQSLGDFMRGTLSIDGVVMLSDGTTYATAAQAALFNHSVMHNPHVTGSIFFTGAAGAYGTFASGHNFGPTSPTGNFFWNSASGTNISVTPGAGLFNILSPTSNATLGLFETTGGLTGTVRLSGGTLQMFSPANKQVQILAGGSGVAAKLTIDPNSGPVLPTYTVGTRPASPIAGAVIYVSDGGVGAVFQGWNGAAWVNLG